ncbi:DUF2971 domain-containing protein [Psychroflexus aestuariivivens]|uniref:DUF2971 domain-containing protein n=1 Tax=Psychroflexus aestuariivivens TaxID=1795040 RepID=UPI000FDBF732|nr:DUF2971 domain-containing protein [Psychroflexus aestuariivivens]
MWEKYGNKGKGVVLKFKLNYNKEHEFLFGNIKYGRTGLGNIEKLKTLAEKFRRENNNFTYENFPERILELLAFHKQNKFKSEKEVRLFFN